MPAISFLPFLQTVPFGTRLLTFSLIVLTLSAYLIRGLASRHSDVDGQLPWQDLPWLVMVPGKSFKYPWTLLSSGWIEINPIEVGLTESRLFLKMYQSLPIPHPPPLIPSPNPSPPHHQTVPNLPHHSSTRMSLPRTSMGTSRTRSFLNHNSSRFKHHRFWIQLVGLDGYRTRGYFLASHVVSLSFWSPS